MIVRGSAELRSGGSGRGNGEGASGAKMRFLDIAAGACRPGRRQQDPPASRRQFSDQHSGFFVQASRGLIGHCETYSRAL